MTRRLLLGAIDANARVSGQHQNKKEAKQSRVTNNEHYMLTDRSMAGNALIHDQNHTINTQGSDSDSSYGVELSNDTLVNTEGDVEEDYGVEMTEIK